MGKNGNINSTVTRKEETRQRQNQLWMILHVQSDLTRGIHARNGKRLLASLREKEYDAAKRALMKLIATLHQTKEPTRGPAART